MSLSPGTRLDPYEILAPMMAGFSCFTVQQSSLLISIAWTFPMDAASRSCGSILRTKSD